MVITAKFASICPCCNARIEVGSKVEWEKGSKACHVACTGSTSPKATTARRGFVGASGRTYSSALERYRSGDASARAYGWDGVRGSSSYYTSGAYDDE
jgi:hypothetical protein